MTITNPTALDFSKLAAAASIAKQPEIPKIFVAICSSDWKLEIHTSESVRSIANACRCEMVVRYMMNDGVARSRNNLAASFLETDCTHLWFLDSDIIVEARQFALLLEAIADGLKVVAGLYPKKQGVLDWVINFLDDQKADEKGRIKLKHAGTGCLLIAREVIEREIELHPEMEYEGDPAPGALRWDLFPMRAVNRLYESEDWAFCNRLLADGFEIWGHTGVQLRHVGKIVYPLQFSLSDEEVVDIVYHRYGIPHDQVLAFIASGTKAPGLMGGHREKEVRLWPREYPVPDLFEGGIIAGSLDVPINPNDGEEPPKIVDLAAGYGSFMRFALSRWRGATFWAFEPDAAIFPFLQQTMAGVNPAAAKVHGEVKTFSSANAAEIPECNILRAAGPNVGEVLFALAVLGRIDGIDAIIATVPTLAGATVVAEAISSTHELRSLQRAADGQITIKLGALRLRNQN